MKILLLIAAVFCAITVKAQQPKAYETIKYIARNGNIVFNLDYADGYLGASQIRLHEPKHETLVFKPLSGLPEENGRFILSAGPRKISLMAISDDAAPDKIKAVYHFSKRVLALVFYQKR